MKKIVTIGGGTGTFNLLLGLKKYNFDISAIVSMADSGGSNKVIRDEFGNSADERCQAVSCCFGGRGK